MKANLNISEDGKKILAFCAGSRHMSVQVIGTAGTLTGRTSHSQDGTFTEQNTIQMDSTDMTFGLDVNCAGEWVEIETSGTITSATLITEG